VLTAPSTLISYSYDAADRLLSARGTTFTYDKNGNQISRIPPNGKPINFAYDAANRRVSVIGTKANSAFTYDGDGNRIGQAVGSGVYSYVNDVVTALPVVLQESGPDGNISYAQGLGLISESGPGFDYFYHYDGLGSVVGLTDSGAKLAGRYGYDAWGQTDTSIPDPQLGTKNKFRYTGEALDPGTQLYYLRARYYDPSVGRFLTKDLFSGGNYDTLTLHRYLYARNTPTTMIDPSGFTPSQAELAPQETINFGDLRVPRAELHNSHLIQQLRDAFQAESAAASALDRADYELQVKVVERASLTSVGLLLSPAAAAFNLSSESIYLIQVGGALRTTLSAIDVSGILHLH
jgi:RHS repeat-associated protein